MSRRLPLRVLVIEHEELWRNEICKSLVKALALPDEGSVQGVVHLDDAERLLRDQTYDLVITDHMFREGPFTEHELGRRLKERRTPIVVVSSHVKLEHIEEIANEFRLEGLLLKSSLPAVRTGVAKLVKRLIAPTYDFSWIHLSDLHFGADSRTHRFDQAAVCRALVADVARCPTVEAVFVTGDVAYSARADEYTQAATFFRSFAEGAGIDMSKFYFVPGNHDVDRKVADAVSVQAFHKDARAEPNRLDDFLGSGDVRPMLRAKLDSYADFLDENFPSHPRGAADRIDWTHTIDARKDGKKQRVRLVGLSSVWVSDSRDGLASPSSAVFAPNMLIARHQLEEGLQASSSEDIVFLLSHHPPEWMVDGSREQLENYLSSARHVHLCGHVHRKTARLGRELGDQSAPLRLVAGAAHEGEQRNGRAEHGYAWGALRRQSARWQLGWAPRVFVPKRNEMRSDRTRYDLDAQGFAWEDTSW